MKWRLVALYVAAVIGAGFASGQEVQLFFVAYGGGSVIGLAVAFGTLSWGVILVCHRCSVYNLGSYHLLIDSFSGPVRYLVGASFTVLLMAGAAIMLAGMRESLAPELGALSALLPLAVLPFLLTGSKGVTQASQWAVPIIIAGIVVVCLKGLTLAPWEADVESAIMGAGAGALYGGYNLALASAVLAGSCKNASIWDIVFAAIAGSGILVGLATLMSVALDQSGGQSMPMLHLAATWHPIALALYKAVLWLAMFTTCLAKTFALVTRLSIQSNVSWTALSLGVFMVTLVISYAGFSVLIATAYPALGLLGLYMLFRLS